MQGNSYLKSTLRLLLRRRVWGQNLLFENPPSENPPIRFSQLLGTRNQFSRTKKVSLSTGCPSGGGVLRDYLLRRLWMLTFLGKRRTRQLPRSLSSDARSTPCGQGQLFLSYSPRGPSRQKLRYRNHSKPLKESRCPHLIRRHFLWCNDYVAALKK